MRVPGSVLLIVVGEERLDCSETTVSISEVLGGSSASLRQLNFTWAGKPTCFTSRPSISLSQIVLSGILGSAF